MLRIGTEVPWNAAWSDELGVSELRPCRYAEGRLAVWQPHRPGSGTPRFAVPHIVRQRKSIAEMRCTVCGERTVAGNRFWFEHGAYHERWFMTTEAPVHHQCAEHSMAVCPHLRKGGHNLRPFPERHRILMSTLTRDALFNLFHLAAGREVVGQLKIAWPREEIVVAGAGAMDANHSQRLKGFITASAL